jgi:predicted O-methyltransferase YrrM
MENRPVSQHDAPTQLLRDSEWQMSFGERAALEGLLAAVRPALAIEIGTAEGGSLERVAAYSERVHSFDLNFDLMPADRRAALENVTFHAGDSHVLLPELLKELADAGQNVDFVLVDGDHSSEGVKKDMEDLLVSDAIQRTVIVAHDTINEVVRDGLERVRYEDFPKVAYVELDMVAGHLFQEPALLNEMWGGIGLVVVDASQTADGDPRQSRYYEAFQITRAMRDQGAVHEQLAESQRNLARAQEALESIKSSPSWRLTAPLRRLKHAVRDR